VLPLHPVRRDGWPGPAPTSATCQQEPDDGGQQGVTTGAGGDALRRVPPQGYSQRPPPAFRRRGGSDDTTKELKAGTYLITIHDRSAIHDFHLTGTPLEMSSTRPVGEGLR
jgi:hypothetical protein